MTPIRVVCNNTLNVALRGAKRSWATPHVGDVRERIDAARNTLFLANKYMENLDYYANSMANVEVTSYEFDNILNEMFPTSETQSDRKNENARRAKIEVRTAYCAEDLKQFKGTAWGIINAMADCVDHNAPRRKTENYRENNFERILDGHVFVDTIALKLEKLAAEKAARYSLAVH